MRLLAGRLNRRKSLTKHTVRCAAARQRRWRVPELRQQPSDRRSCNWTPCRRAQQGVCRAGQEGRGGRSPATAPSRCFWMWSLRWQRGSSAASSMDCGRVVMGCRRPCASPCFRHAGHWYGMSSSLRPCSAPRKHGQQPPGALLSLRLSPCLHPCLSQSLTMHWGDLLHPLQRATHFCGHPLSAPHRSQAEGGVQCRR